MARPQKTSAKKSGPAVKPLSRERLRQLAALKTFLAHAGSARSRYRDVSSNKYKHVADSVADKP